ncbi:hypothetical protein, partial [uncultured Jannaschia sp.]
SDVTADPALAETDTAETEMPVAEGDTVETTAPVELGGPTVEREGYNLAQAGEFEVESLTGSNLYGVNDEDI